MVGWCWKLKGGGRGVDASALLGGEINRGHSNLAYLGGRKDLGEGGGGGRHESRKTKAKDGR